MEVDTSLSKNSSKDHTYDIVSPEPSALIESLRAFGYTPEAAIADLIDNSITARAKNIWLQFIWNGSNSYIMIRDDGRGMSAPELVTAMRAGSQSPLEERAKKDLGRFGLGLKTASFSQCRVLTVASKSSISPSVTIRRWDLNYVSQTSEWRLLHGAAPTSDQHFTDLITQKCGTIVLWENIDRMVGRAHVDDQKAQKRFFNIMNNIEKHIAVVFHRFLEAPRNINIYINNHKIKSWDPFLTTESSTQCLPEETFRSNGEVIKVRSYVLPHHSKISAQMHNDAAGPKGWNAQQGFYVYRNQRLLLAGDWLGLGFQKEEHYKLARIAIDLPNTTDQEWDIDVRKSRARPPGELHDTLHRIAEATRRIAFDVYRHRGKILARKISEKDIFLWNRVIKNGKVSFQINREQPLVADLLQVPSEYQAKVEALLRMVEETIPIPLIMLESAEKSEVQLTPFANTSSAEILETAKQTYLAIRKQKIAHEQAIEKLLSIEPFTQFKELIISLSETEIMGNK